MRDFEKFKAELEAQISQYHVLRTGQNFIHVVGEALLWRHLSVINDST